MPRLHEYFERVNINWQILPELKLERGEAGYIIGASGRPHRWYEREPKLCVPSVQVTFPCGPNNPTTEEIGLGVAALLDESAGLLLLKAAQDAPPLRSGHPDDLKSRAVDALGIGEPIFHEVGDYLLAFDPTQNSRVMCVFNDLTLEEDEAWISVGFALTSGRGVRCGRLA